MGDTAYTVLLVWPYPGQQQLPPDVFEQLAVDRLLPVADTPNGGDYGGRGAIVLAGDDDSGPILKIVHPDAECGIERFRQIIGDLHEAGLQVLARNEGGSEFHASWEHQHAEGPVAFGYLNGDGELTVTAAELLEGAGADDLDALSDVALCARVRERLVWPAAIPAAVKEAL